MSQSKRPLNPQAQQREKDAIKQKAAQASAVAQNASSGGSAPGQPAKKAVALKYNADKDAAPVVIASGYGPIADKIIDIAEQRGIPVYRDDSAASMLCMLGVGANIPEELYQVVAAIYSQILRVAAKVQRGESGPLNPTTRQSAVEKDYLLHVTAEAVESEVQVQSAKNREEMSKS